MISILTLLYLLLVPLGVMQLAKRWTWIDKVTPMTILYIIGLLMGNTLFFDLEIADVCQTVSNLAVPLCLPLMLFGCNLKNWSTPNALKAFLTGLLSILVVTVAGFFIFGGISDQISPTEFAKVTAVSTGIYTGGIPNIAAISKGVNLSDNLYIIITSYDLIATGCYLIFVIFFGKTLFRKLLPVRSVEQPTAPAADGDGTQLRPDSWKKKLLLAGLTLLLAGVSYTVTLLVCGQLNIAVLILILTTLSLLMAQVKQVNQQSSSFDMGLYVVYVFCLAIASMVNIQEIKIFDYLNILGYIFFVIFGSIVLQVILAKIVKLDGDTIMVSSVALINSPPFVPMVAGLLGNKQVILTGISIGLLGYALGNYLALALYQLLLLLL